MNQQVSRFLLELIEMDKWDLAKWIEVAFMVSLREPATPMLCLVYKHPEIAKEIFAGARARITRDDEEELLRIAIIEGVSQENPHAFTVKISPYMDHVLRHFDVEIRPGEHEDYLSFVRFKTTSPPRPFPLLREFKEHVERIGKYNIIPAAYINQSLVPFVELAVRKREIFFRHRSEIAPGDVDAVVLKERLK
jgi:hypothetical protein